MAAITPIKYAETSTGSVRNPMRDFVSNLPNIYNQYLTILDRNRQRELQDAQFAESKRQFEEAQALEQQKLEAQNLQNLAANTLGQQKVKALIQANEDNRQYQRDTLDFARGEPGRRINEKFINYFLNSFGNPYGVNRGSSSSSSSSSSGGYKRDAGLDNRIQKDIDYYYSLAKDIDTLSTYIAKLKNTSNDSEFNEWFSRRPKEEQDELIRLSALSGKKIGEKIDYAKLAASLSEQLDKKHSQAQSVYANITSYIDNINESLGWPAYNKPVNLFPERHPDAIRAEYEKNLLEQDKINAANKAKRERAKKLQEEIERIAFGSNDNSSGSSQGKFGAPAKAESRVETDATKIADYLQGLQRTVYDAGVLRNRGTNPISLGIGNPGDPYFNGVNNVYDAGVLINRGTNPISLGIGNPGDPYFNGGNNVYEQYLEALKAGKIR
jgi:hypothetical protein